MLQKEIDIFHYIDPDIFISWHNVFRNGILLTFHSYAMNERKIYRLWFYLNMIKYFNLQNL